MGRTVRHFTGRVDLWNPSLQAKIEEQLRPQLWKIATDSIKDVTRTSSERTLSRSMIKIKIRLSVHGQVIKEDILWDPSLPDYSPIDFAETLGEELNLSDEAVVAVATTIVEQLHGIEVEDSGEKSPTNSDRLEIGATMLDQKEHVSTVGHIVAFHRPDQT